MVILVDILGVRVAIEGPSFLVEELGREYPHSRILENEEAEADVRLKWDGLTCHVCKWGRGFQAESENLISTVTRVLLRRALADIRPEVIFLHGNAVVRDGGLLVIIGASGAGKTTLSLEMLEREVSSALLAEDLLAIDAEKGELLPFPRASRIKDGEHRFFRTQERLCLKAESLSGADVVFLRPDVHKREAAHCIVLSAWTHEARLLVGEALPQESLVEWMDSTPVVSFNVPPSAAQMKQLAGALDRQGILVLSTAMPGKGRALKRPTRPIVRPLAWDEILDEAMANMVGPISQPGGTLMLALGRAFSRSRCCSMIPGGTPAETIDALVEFSHAA